MQYVKLSDPSIIHRPLGQEFAMNRILSFAPYTTKELMLETPFLFSPLTSVLPPNVHLLTLEPLPNNEFLLRLEHFYERDEALGNDVVIQKNV
jgi:hypothetical protein